MLRQPAPQVRPDEASEEVGRGLAFASRRGGSAWLPVSRSPAHGRHRPARGRRTRARHRGGYRAPVTEDAGALLARAAQGQGPDARPARGAAQEGDRVRSCINTPVARTDRQRLQRRPATISWIRSTDAWTTLEATTRSSRVNPRPPALI